VNSQLDAQANRPAIRRSASAASALTADSPAIRKQKIGLKAVAVSSAQKLRLWSQSMARTSKSGRIGKHGVERTAPNLQQEKC
jgi:hypothetical protein